MAELNLPFGPWKKLASAEWNEHPLSVYINNESLLLMTVFDKNKDGQVNGMLSLLKKPLLLDGNSDAFSSSQKRELVFLEKRSPDYHVRYLLLESTPYYIEYTQSELVQTLQRQHQEIQGLTKLIVDSASVFDVKVRELTSIDSKPMELLVGDPFTLFALSGVPPSGEGLRSTGRATRVKLGLDASNTELEVLSTSMEKVFVIGENKMQRLHAVHVLCESMLSAGIPLLIFDSTKSLAGLSVPTKDATGLEPFGLTPLPNPFPFKAYALGKGLFIDLRFVDVDWFADIMGLENKEIHSVLDTAYPEASSLEDVLQHISDLKETKQVPQYAIAKALRALRVLQKSYPSVFGKNTFAELSAPWETGVPKVYYVELDQKDGPLRELLILSLLSALKEPPNPVSLGCIFEPSVETLSHGLKTLAWRKKNLSVIFHAPHEADFEPAKNATLELDLLNDSVIASEPHQEKKRFQLRPPLTMFSESGMATEKN